MSKYTSFSVHNVYSSHMVLQRNKPILIAGTGVPQARVSGKFDDLQVEAIVKNDGEWVLEFPPCKEGGPHTITVTSNTGNTYTFEDILIGDVWVCSGQSNMQFPVSSANQFWSLKDGKSVAESADDDGIRLLDVKREIQPCGPCDELSGDPKWQPATSADAVAPFSAVAYFFAQTLRTRLNKSIPIGLINTCWGGTRIEPWMPLDAFNPETDQKELQQQQIAVKIIEEGLEPDEGSKKLSQEALARFEIWLNEKFNTVAPEATAKALAEWPKPNLDESTWFHGARGRGRFLSNVGVTWFRKTFTVPTEWEGKDIYVELGMIDDCDETFLDGEKIGQTLTDVKHYWAQLRKYKAKLEKTPDGRHVLAVRVINHFNYGVFQDPIIIRCDELRETIRIDDENWAEKQEFAADVEKIGTRPDVPSSEMEFPFLNPVIPTTLYNSMIHPLTYINIAGFTWYQGCSNANMPDRYREFQRALISSWRKIFRDDNLPFIITQLSAFKAHSPANRGPEDWWKETTPTQFRGYAPFRDMQMGFLDERLCGVACTIDIGDAFDIHPANKRDVGIRLANEAMRLAYGDKAAIPGPRAIKAVREGDKVRVSFRDAGEGLYVDGDTFGPHLFALGDDEEKYDWAEGVLDKDGTLLVSSPNIKTPTVVEYAYNAYPPLVNFRRKGDDFPVFPFRIKL